MCSTSPFARFGFAVATQRHNDFFPTCCFSRLGEASCPHNEPKPFFGLGSVGSEGRAMLEVSGIRIPLSKLDGTDAQELRACRRALAGALRVSGRTSCAWSAVAARSTPASAATVPAHVHAAPELVAGRASAPRQERSASSTRPPSAFPRRRLAGRGAPSSWAPAARASSARSPWRAPASSPCSWSAGDRTPPGAPTPCAGTTRPASSNPESNIQFGVGGAGTFSDGKLQTGTKSPAHRLILETFAEAGAQRQILWDAKPHIGSDVLPRVVTRIVPSDRGGGRRGAHPLAA